MKVTVEDTWGDESRILDTARLSASDKRADQDNLTLQDKRLLRELLYAQHGVPFETVCLRIRMEIPIFVARQLVKHRMSSWSEMSKRYRGGVGEFYVPTLQAFTVEVPGYAPFTVITQKEIKVYTELTQELGRARERWLKNMYDRIEAARAQGLLPPDPKTGRDPYRARAREAARLLEPVSEYTEVVWTMNARSAANVFFLRLDEHAQHETRWVAEQIWIAFKEAFPLLSRFMERYREKIWQAHQELLAEPMEE